MALRLACATGALCWGLAASASITSCGAPGDHLSNVNIALSPDPLVKGKPFTLTVAGTLDEDHVGGSVSLDLQVKALGIISKKITETITYTLSPGIVKGGAKVAIGPVSLPKELPGEVSLAGRVQIKNGKAEPVACVNLNLNVPVLESADGEAAAGNVSRSMDRVATASCAKSTDHLKNIKISTSGGVTTTTATLDEDLAAANVLVDVTVKELFIKIPLKLNVPLAWSPALAKGDWKVTSSKHTEANGLVGVTAQGQVVVNDGQGTEVTCMAINAHGEDVAIVV